MIRKMLLVLGIGTLMTSFMPIVSANAASEDLFSSLESRSISDDYNAFFDETNSISRASDQVELDNFIEEEHDWQIDNRVELVVGDTLEERTIFGFGPDSNSLQDFNRVKVQYELLNLESNSNSD